MSVQIRPLAFSGVTRREPKITAEQPRHGFYPFERHKKRFYADGVAKDRLIAADQRVVDAMTRKTPGSPTGDYAETDASRAAMRERERLMDELAAQCTDEPEDRPLKHARLVAFA